MEKLTFCAEVFADLDVAEMTFTAGREAIDANSVPVSELCFTLCEEGRALVWLIVNVDAHSLVIVVHD